MDTPTIGTLAFFGLLIVPLVIASILPHRETPREKMTLLHTLAQEDIDREEGAVDEES